jgi:hypothetical protein
MSATKKRATIEQVGYRTKLNENGILRKFVSLCDAIDFCNKHKVQVTNKEILTTFFQSKLIY